MLNNLSINTSPVSHCSMEIVELESVRVEDPQPNLKIQKKLSSKFWVIIFTNVILLIAIGLMSWQLNEEVHKIREIKSHEIRTHEQLLSEISLNCGKLYQLGFKTPSDLVMTRTLTYDCPLKDGQCSCESYSNAWILKQTLYSIYYPDTDPNNYSHFESNPREAQFGGLIAGLCVSGFFWLATVMGAISNYFDYLKLSQV